MSAPHPFQTESVYSTGMRLFLSSSGFGNHGDRLVEMAGKGATVALIANALDNLPKLRRDYLRETVLPLFDRHGFRVELVDLRSYFNGQADLAGRLSRFRLIWACGGNSFLLRRAMKFSGFDAIIRPLLRESDVIYGGWSAGSVVAGRDLYGIDTLDDASATAEAYPPSETIWDGLSLVAGTLVPHVHSDHREGAAATVAVPIIEATGRTAIPLCDGEVLVEDGSGISILR